MNWENFWQAIWTYIIEPLIFEVPVVVAGALIAALLINPIRKWWDKRNYGRWVSVLEYKDYEILERPISPNQVKKLLDEPYELGVYCKGIISTYGRLHCDPLETKDLIKLDKENRRLVIDLDQDENFAAYDVLLKAVAAIEAAKKKAPA
ncbi:MAG: hypothetical protein ACK2UT_11400 [Candidatus Promineifilaceae bacterium]